MKKQQPSPKNHNTNGQKPSRRKNQPAGSVAPILNRLGKYLRPHLLLILLTVLAAVLTSVLELAPPVLIRLAVDRFIIGDNPEYIWFAAGGLLVVALFQGGIDFVRLYLTAYTGQKIIFKLRNSIFNHINRLSFSFFDEARTGDLMSRVTTDVEVLNQFFGRAAVIILTNIITLIGILVILFRWNWRLAFTYILLIPLIVLGMWAYARKVRPAWKRVQIQLAGLRESLIQKAMKEISKDRTTLIIAHRFSTLSQVEKILVLDQGKMVGYGAHQELIKSNTVYQKLYQQGFQRNSSSTS